MGLVLLLRLMLAGMSGGRMIGVAIQTHGKIGPCSKVTTLKTLPMQNVSDTPTLPKPPQEPSKKVCNSSLGWPQLADSSIEWEFGRVGQQGVRSVGLVHSPRLRHYGGKYSTQE